MPARHNCSSWQFESRFSDRKSIALRQRPQLLQREPATATGLGYQDAATNSLVLALGTMILRTHVERHLRGSFTTPNQLERWQASVNTLLREGLFRQTGNDGAVSS